MEFVFIFILLIVILLSLGSVIKDRLSRLFGGLIFSYWFLALFISQFNPLGLYAVSGMTNVLIILGTICFILGYSAIPSEQFKKNTQYGSDYVYGHLDVDYILKNRYIWIIFLICLYLIIDTARRQWAVILLQGGLGNLKLDVFDLVFSNNHILYLVYQVIMFPIFHICCAVLSFLILNYRGKSDIKYILIIALYILAFCFVGGKRAYFLTFFFYFIFILGLSSSYVVRVSKQKGFMKKAILPISLFFVLTFSGMTIMTSLGGGTDIDKDRASEVGSNLLKQFVTYSIGSIRAFDIALDKDYLNEAGGYLYGRASLGGALDYYSCSLLNRLGINAVSARAKTMSKLQDTEIIIGKDTSFNYAYTSFMYFYYDFGFIGILFFSFLYGYFVRYLILKLSKYRTVGAMAVVGFQLFVCIQYLQFWGYIALYAQPILLYCYIAHKNEIKQKLKSRLI